jgi:hypothetical protein
MTTLEQLREWSRAGILSDAHHDTLAALVRRERFSLFLELNALLYIGVLSLVGGLGWTFQTYFTNLGDPLILSILSALCAACLYYCFSHAAPYSHGEVEPPSLAFVYVLYLGCLLFSSELAYIEFRFHLLRDTWDYYLLFTAAAFALLAYRFDNRFVLSLALASLAGWFGLKLSAFGWISGDVLRMSALAYGAAVAGLGATLYRQGIKPHFVEVYLHLAANAGFMAMVSGVRDSSAGAFYLLALVLLSTTSVVLGIRFNRFAFVAYAAVYGYAGLSMRVLSYLTGTTATLGYFVVTGTLMIAGLAALARRFGRGE